MISPIAEASFWSLVSLNFPSECWLWIGMVDGQYGRFKVGRRRYAAHRLAYALAYGHCPDDLVVRHTCDTPLCVAPHHLILGTDAENIADRDQRNRTARGECGGNAILTELAVKEIRSDSRIARVIAAEYGVHKSTVAKIKSRANWRHCQ